MGSKREAAILGGTPCFGRGGARVLHSAEIGAFPLIHGDVLVVPDGYIAKGTSTCL